MKVTYREKVRLSNQNVAISRPKTINQQSHEYYHVAWSRRTNVYKKR